MDIVVLAGGLSDERDVSLSSGSLIANTLAANGHRALLLDLYLGLPGAEDFEAAWALRPPGEYAYKVPEAAPDLPALRALHGERQIGPGVLGVCRAADVVFLGLHGGIGENGRLQALFDIEGIRYTGAGCAGSLLAMDKPLSKELMRAAGVPTPHWEVRRAGSRVPAPFLPCVVKPAQNGSSVGVSLAEDAAAFAEAVVHAARYEDTLLIEKLVRGREFSVGVLDGEALPVIEILPAAEFYDYKNKYQPGLAREECPARLPERQARELRQAALDVHALLRLGAYSRVDFIVDEAGRPWCLEANTLPGMTPTSLLPQEAVAAGIGYGELCERIVRRALRP